MSGLRVRRIVEVSASAINTRPQYDRLFGRDPGQPFLSACMSEGVMALHREASEEHRIASVQEMASQSAQRKRELPRHRPGISERGPRLTRRERQIVALLMEGCANKEIAARLATSEQTIKNQLSTLYRKARVSSRLELVLLVQTARGVTAARRKS